MILIEIPDELPEEIQAWKVKAKAITELIKIEDDLVKKHKLIDKHGKHWRNEALIKWLSDLSCEKCWYTETKFGADYQELEHFRPKKELKIADKTFHATHPGYYWLAFDISNYRLCKSRPNRKKGTFFPILDERFRACNCEDDWQDERPVFLDPMDDEDVLLISFDDNGKPVPAIGIESQDIERVNFTIEKYFLDERVLNIRRKETWTACRCLFNKYLQTSREAKVSARGGVAKSSRAKSDLKALRKMLKRDQEFSTVARASLIKLDDPIAIGIVSSVAG